MHECQRIVCGIQSKDSNRALAQEVQLLPLTIDMSEILSEPTAQLWREFWVSLASLLRSYTAAHGLNRRQQATVELGEAHIVVRAGERWLQLNRTEARVGWIRENQTNGTMQLTIDGRLKDEAGAEEDMDMQAEAWARELMQ